jgi:hypothetical protein
MRRLATMLAAVLGVTAARAEVPVPTVTGPITGPGNPFVASTTIDLASLGYSNAEFFLEGTATGYTSAEPLGDDGRWTAAPATSAAYKTRILVRRPTDSARFNGTVVVEWLNVSGGLDAAPDWIFAHTLLMREGYAWVGVSAQKVGIEGGPNPLGLDLSLKAQNPARYGSLVHPGDTFSFDLYSQVAAAIRSGTPAPLGDLAVERVIAMGESQSAFRLTTYVNAVHAVAKVYDGYLIHSRGGSSAALSQAPEADVPAPELVRVRDDLAVPVITLQSETDVFLLGFLEARQKDSKRFRLWEVAGTAHGDLYQLIAGWTDEGPGALDTTYLEPVIAPIPGIIECDAAVNQGPHHYVVSAAISQLDRWIRFPKRAPKKAPRLRVDGEAFVVDKHGNVRGGVRTPQVDVPLATLSGLGQTGAAFCRLFGTTIPFDDAKVASLYPSHAKYVAKVKRSGKAAVKKGVLLPADYDAIVAAAEASDIGR